MSVRIPSASDLPVYDPRPATRLPQYPNEDPAAAACSGKGRQEIRRTARG
jgi:hypothetical protein